jgi:nucleotide-binding universal stress UspA family protein
VLHSRDTAAAIVDYAETHGIDHIVTGSSGRVGIPRFVLGSVAGEIIHRAHCPVTVVR